MDREKELGKLNRAELLELLISQIKENEALIKADKLQKKEYSEMLNKLNETNDKLKNRDIIIENSGSIAEAALKINDVFLSAERAAQQYVENIERLSAQQELNIKTEIQKAEEEAERILMEARNNARLIELESHRKASSMISDAQSECEKKKEEINEFWNELSMRLETFYQSHQGLKSLINSSFE